MPQEKEEGLDLVGLVPPVGPLVVAVVPVLDEVQAVEIIDDLLDRVFDDLFELPVLAHLVEEPLDDRRQGPDIFDLLKISDDRRFIGGTVTQSPGQGIGQPGHQFGGDGVADGHPLVVSSV